MINMFWLAAALSCLAWAVALSRRNRHPLLLAAAGDEDMKIAPSGGFSQSAGAEESSEVAAEQFLKLKSSGNIEKARRLGNRFALLLLEKHAETAGADDSLRAHQQLVLCSYAVTRAVSDCAPHSLLAQTSMNVFYDCLEDSAPELYRHISDVGALSLYILCERSHQGRDHEIGEVYARLCGAEGDAALSAEGNELYRRFYEYCAMEHDKINYSGV